jgi:dTDP-4-amino-4,6-dideoxygalactose transaminase
MTTGEGGMVTTASSALAESIRRHALHGLSHDAWARFTDAGYRHYTAAVAGFKYNMTDLQAALGIHQLGRIERGLRRRNEIWQRYDEAFAGLPVALPPPPEPETIHARHLYTLCIDPASVKLNRDTFMDRLHRLNIGVGVHFIGVHLQPYYAQRFGYRPQDFPNATWISERTISLPLSARLRDEDVEDVIRGVSQTLG